jgi:flavin reductase (DIM6/NTAB) family NADH-FMN oxidoreductase RutF
VSDDELTTRLRAAHRNYPTGVTVITVIRDGQPYGLAVNAFSSVSLDPPTVLFCVNESSKTHEHLVASSHVGINILGHQQHDVASVFATSGGDKFSQVEWETGKHGVPLIAGASSRFETEVIDRHVVGTHSVFMCQVLEAEASEHAPLLYFRGTFADGRLISGDPAD